MIISDENASFTNSKLIRKLLQQFLFIFVIYFGIFPHLKLSLKHYSHREKKRQLNYSPSYYLEFIWMDMDKQVISKNDFFIL